MFFRLTYPKLVLLISVLFFPVAALSQQSFSGYYRFESGLLTSSSGEFLFNRNIIQPEFRHQGTDFSLNLAVQVRQRLDSQQSLSPDFRLRDAFVDFRREKFDLRIGHQTIAWGRADASQIHDFITPLDLSEFLTQDFTDLRTGVTATNLTYYRENNSFQLIFIPVFNPSELSPPESRWSAWPTDEVLYNETTKPEPAIKNAQIAARWNNRSRINLDIDVSLYSGFNPTPSLSKRIVAFFPSPDIEVKPVYKRNHAVLLGAEYRVNQHLVLTSEQALWFSTHFDELPSTLRGSIDGITFDPSLLVSIQQSDFLTQSPYLQSLWGLRFPFVTGTLSMQYTLEYIAKHTPSMLQNKYHHTGSLLYTRNTTDERWNLRLLSRYHLDGKDTWVNPEVTFAGIDGIRVSSGSHLFFGNEPDPFYGHLTFYQFRNNSFIYLKLTAYW